MIKQKMLDRILVIAFIFVIMFLVAMTSMGFILKILNLNSGSREGLMVMSVYQALLVFIAPSLIASRIIYKKPLAFLTLNRAPKTLPLVGVVFAYLIALPALNQLIYWNEHITFPESLRQFGEACRYLEDQAQQTTGILLQTDSVSGLLTGVLVIGIITGFSEELFFRGTLQNEASTSGKYHLAIWIVAFIFSAIHFQIFGFIPRMLLGAWFGYLFYWTGNIYVPMVAHILNNSSVVLCSWLNNRGVDMNFEMIGVSTSGFPIAAMVSFAAMVIFITYFRSFFFQDKKLFSLRLSN